MEKHITLPLTEELADTLHAGDTVYLTGTIYTSRDAGHKRMCETLAKCELIAYEDLGAEALRKLYVEEMPLVVIIDSQGNNLYEEGKAAYLASRKQR